MKFFAKKSLGQNFLIDKNILNKIINVAPIKDKSILEIGPGTGNLTSYILKKNPKKFIVIEKDKNLVMDLKRLFKNKITIINQDILEVEEKLLANDKLNVFGNLPYNISTEILCKWILNLDKKEFWFSNLILMFQKEVADSYLCKPPKMKFLSNCIQIYSNPELILNVDPESFEPMPNVKSSVINLILKPAKNIPKTPEKVISTIKIGFDSPRKKIRNSFTGIERDNLPIGVSTEIISYGALENLMRQDLDFNYSEYMTFYFINNPNLFSVNIYCITSIIT